MTRAGHDVWLIDQWPEHVEVMKSKGLHITMPEGDLDLKVRALHLCEVASLKKPFDIVFLTSKSPDTRLADGVHQAAFGAHRSFGVSAEQPQ